MKKIILFYMFFWSILVLSQTTKQQLKENAQQKYYVENFRGAISDFDTLLKQFPNDSSAYNDRGLIKELIHDYKGALRDFSKEIKIDPTFADSYFFRAMVKDKIGDKKGAVSDYKMTVKFEPKNSDAYYFMGIDQFKCKQYYQALANFKLALTKRDDNYAVYADMGLLYAQYKKYKKALYYCDKAIRLDKTISKAYLYKGWILAQDKNYKQALMTFYDVFKEDSSVEDNLYYGHLKKNYKSFKKVLFDFNKTNKDSAYFAKGILNQYLKNYSQALHYYDKTIQLNPNCRDVFEKKAQVEQILGLNNNALADYTKSLESSSSRKDKILYEIALIYYKKQDCKNALIFINKAIQMNEFDTKYASLKSKIQKIKAQ